jgi:NAD(P)-dependent dehydrogenase (short-subunit alcohol dehydrogenase family)
VDLHLTGTVAVVTSRDGPVRLVDQAVAVVGGIDVLVNDVGALVPRLGGFLAVTDENREWTLSMNFRSAVRATRAALPHLVRRTAPWLGAHGVAATVTGTDVVIDGGLVPTV